MRLTNLIVALTELPAFGPTGPATEFRLFPFGPHTSEKGTFVFDKQSAQSVLKAWRRKNHDIAIDYGHAMVEDDGKYIDPAEAQKAAGWFNLEVRGDGKNPDTDGLWAVNVKWTPTALSYLTNKEYRFYSPAFLYNPKTNHIEELVNVALTNTPAQHDQTPLIAASDKPTPQEPKTMKTLLATLKLSENASEAEALSALATLQNEVAKRADEVTKLVACTGKATVAEAIGAIEGMKVAIEAGAKNAEELKALKAEKRARQLDALIAQGMKDKKITPATKERFVALGTQKNGLKALKAFLEAAGPVVGKDSNKGGGKNDRTEADVAQVMATLSADEKRIARDGGITLEAFAKAKAAHTAARGGPRTDAELDA